MKEFGKKTYSLSQAQMASLEAKLNDIEAAARRIGRKDWRLLFCGVMFTVIVTVSCPQKPYSASSRWCSTGLDHLFPRRE